MERTEGLSSRRPHGRTGFLAAALLAAGFPWMGCLAPVLVTGGYTEVARKDEVVRWPEDLAGGAKDPMPTYELAESVAGAVQDRCISRQDLDSLSGGSARPSQVRIQSIRRSSGMPATNWALLPYNLLSAASLGIVPMVFLYDQEIAATARLERPPEGTAPVSASASDYKAEWLFCPLGLGPGFALVERRWDSPSFGKNLGGEVAARLLRALVEAPLSPGPAAGREADSAEPLLIPCFPKRD